MGDRKRRCKPTGVCCLLVREVNILDMHVNHTAMYAGVDGYSPESIRNINGIRRVYTTSLDANSKPNMLAIFVISYYETNE